MAEGVWSGRYLLAFLVVLVLVGGGYLEIFVSIQRYSGSWLQSLYEIQEQGHKVFDLIAQSTAGISSSILFISVWSFRWLYGTPRSLGIRSVPAAG